MQHCALPDRVRTAPDRRFAHISRITSVAARQFAASPLPIALTSTLSGTLVGCVTVAVPRATQFNLPL